ncbi:SRPBCC domain-containing protein [Rubrivivax sp. JA1024]|nr:SRPBCC domain-containing protein [Rubrivivax sp. JA1024]
MLKIETDIEIRASAEVVWGILADLPAYREWNPLIRQASGSLDEGGTLDLFISTPGLADRKVGVQLLKVEPLRELRWLGRLWMPRLLDGDHSFLIRPLGEDRVIVAQKEAFRGLLVPIVAPSLIPNMTRGFEAMNIALKQRAEHRAASAGRTAR